MTPPRYNGAPGTAADPARRAGAANRRTRKGRAESGHTRTHTLPGHPDSDSGRAFTARQLEDLWDCHGTSVYTLACALLGDETAASQAVTRGTTDLSRSAGSGSTNDLRSWARHVYWCSQELAGETTRTAHQPPGTVGLGQLAHLQRTCLALCLFGGHNYREAAGLLGLPPMTVADLLTSGLKEIKRLAADKTTANA